MSDFLLTLARAYGYVLGVAAGGFIGANFAGFIPICIEFATSPQKRPDASFYDNWVHGGWWVGTILFAGAAVVHWWRKPARIKPVEEEQPEDDPDLDEGSRRRPIKSRLATMGLFGLGGGILGMCFGGSLLLLWFSLTYSPFSPEDWARSLSLGEIVDSGRERPVVTTDHPIALYAFIGPIVLGATVGFVAGAFPKAKVFTVDRVPEEQATSQPMESVQEEAKSK